MTRTITGIAITDEKAEELLMKWATRQPMSCTEISICLGYSRERVRQIEKSAMGKIRAVLARELHMEEMK